ncbi:hypothetical protein AGABI1DRAFT_114213 [Agaricus bisporus var. burnettii JB137-S8]|uniref:DSBA-like thioredoxin domain-containing protein n=2 Tax=Agaricus bisporus var. burnettii TaxID=192524 RepID=K5XU66_AGABU|nr:hypothetical protein AGABI2DRAFT_191229 [Agaricus bisporus var. bisporus H97]XP_007330461.1 uncharacterized protein AGABI1DRAFT_114213 [Agaricus bisporus var. burnettii JB137-S8]EKM78590.1 hypothetical protein AGABI1DRAFT_114213 [Agaricus bisporus var. burnettii JB137-S8]EKV49144.1 hypothetical protein AGABI2DRAFT_191229 [Agaricus bisporus var. bisporus H97]KAF7773332.1 hypothetical protein Agabi119p4_5499 [Agaricus bisporus var. burnettii]
MSTRVVKLAVVSDFVCTSCYIIQHELTTAIDYCKRMELPLEFQFQHIPFRLIGPNCLKPNTTITKSKFYDCLLGEERGASLRRNVAKWAEEKNIPISFNGLVGQTTGAHRLCFKAAQVGGQELQLKLITALFEAHLIHDKDTSDVNVLADTADSVGVMTRDEALEFLETDEFDAEVKKIADAARTKGISGVPITIIDGKWAVSGGQSADVFIQIFKKLAACGINSSPSALPGPAVPTQICSS